MPSTLYWIDTPDTLRLAIMARPRADDWLEDEIAHWRDSGVGIVVSLLEDEEVEALALQREAGLCADSGIAFHRFPIPDRGLPDDTGQAMRFAAEIASAGKPIAIHCRAGIGRSSLMAAAMLVADGMDPVAALTAIESARGLSIPDTEAQRAWVLALER